MTSDYEFSALKRMKTYNWEYRFSFIIFNRKLLFISRYILLSFTLESSTRLINGKRKNKQLLFILLIASM